MCVFRLYLFSFMFAPLTSGKGFSSTDAVKESSFAWFTIQNNPSLCHTEPWPSLSLHPAWNELLLITPAFLWLALRQGGYAPPMTSQVSKIRKNWQTEWSEQQESLNIHQTHCYKLTQLCVCVCVFRWGQQSGEPAASRSILQETQTDPDGILALAAAPPWASLWEKSLRGWSREEAAGQRAVPDRDAGRHHGKPSRRSKAWWEEQVDLAEKMMNSQFSRE